MSEMVVPLDVPLFSRIVLSILVFLLFHMKRSVVLLRSVNNSVGILMGIALNLLIAFGKTAIFYYVNPTIPKPWEIFPFSDIFFNFFLQRFKVLAIQVFHFFGWSYTKMLYVICSCCERWCFSEWVHCFLSPFIICL